MQLFIVSQLEKKGKQIFLRNVPELLSQVRKVLRGKIGDIISIQPQEGEITRYTIQITDRTDKDLVGEIVDTAPLQKGGCSDSAAGCGGTGAGGSMGGATGDCVTMLIAMPNKREKAELIVQKLSEIGVSEIVFRPAERSVITQWNEKKADRLQKIAKEAVEQSRGVSIPKISGNNDVKKVCEGKKVIVFDMIPLMKGGKDAERNEEDGGGECHGEQGGKLGVIGPEGGLTEKDYQLFEPYEVVGLGENILRIETAAIIGGRKLKNL